MRPEILQSEFAATARQDCLTVARECHEYSNEGIPGLGLLMRGWMIRYGVEYIDYVEAIRPNPDQMAQRFGFKSVGRSIEMIDFENRMLRSIAVPDDVLPLMTETVESFLATSQYYFDVASCSFEDNAGVVAAQHLLATTQYLDQKCAAWKEAVQALIDAGEEFAEWQNEILVQDEDNSYGAYAERVEDTKMKDVLARREQFMRDIELKYRTALLIVEEIALVLEGMSSHYESLAGHAATEASVPVAVSQPPAPC